MCQLFYQLPEIDAGLGHKVEDDALAAEYMLGIDYFHRQSQLVYEVFAAPDFILSDFSKVPLFAYIVAGGEADEFAGRLFGEIDLAVIEIFFYLFVA